MRSYCGGSRGSGTACEEAEEEKEGKEEKGEEEAGKEAGVQWVG